MRPQAEWNVITHMRAAMRPPTSCCTRSFISVAARLVKVIASISVGEASSWSIRCAIRCVSTRVLPEPAPATTSSGPSVHSTASRCCGFRASSVAAGAAISRRSIRVLRRLKRGSRRDSSGASGAPGGRVPGRPPGTPGYPTRTVTLRLVPVALPAVAAATTRNT